MLWDRPRLCPMPSTCVEITAPRALSDGLFVASLGFQPGVLKIENLRTSFQAALVSLRISHATTGIAQLGLSQNPEHKITKLYDQLKPHPAVRRFVANTANPHSKSPGNLDVHHIDNPYLPPRCEDTRTHTPDLFPGT